MSTTAATRSARPRFATKAEWADAQATALEEQLVKLQFQSTAGHAAARARKSGQLAHLTAEASKFRRLAAHYRRTGQ